MTAPAVRAAFALMWLQLHRILERLGAAVEVIDRSGFTADGEVVIYTGRDSSGAWVC